MDLNTNDSTARCLDLTRLLSRVGRGPWTGIDRVEFEYLRALSGLRKPLFGIARTAMGIAILEPEGVQKLLSGFAGTRHWGASDFKSYLLRNSNSEHRQAVSDTWRFAARVVSSSSFGREIKDIFPDGIVYINVGHSNISKEILEAFQQMRGARTVVMLHDTIPLDYPEFQRPGTVSKFSQKLELISDHADLILCNSAQTQADVSRHLAGLRKCPELSVAQLGVRVAKEDHAGLLRLIEVEQPYFVTVGTIEPRKNHAMLLDIWARFENKKNAPHLYIIGRRGWNNRAVFERLDMSPKGVTEIADLSDGALVALLSGAKGLLFPSLAEGFGLPPAEAAMLGVPVICRKLSIFKEIMGEYPIYADASDLYDWETKIEKLVENDEIINNSGYRQPKRLDLPTWEGHFDQVLRLV